MCAPGLYGNFENMPSGALVIYLAISKSLAATNSHTSLESYAGEKTLLLSSEFAKVGTITKRNVMNSFFTIPPPKSHAPKKLGTE
jgi:hypothetical protein